MEFKKDNFTISDDPARLDIGSIYDYGVNDGEKQISFARVVTDFAIFAYLCDVFIHEDYRGQALGKWMMESILAYPELQGLRRWCLLTRDAHGLCSQFGFTELSDPPRWMEKSDAIS